MQPVLAPYGQRPEQFKAQFAQDEFQFEEQALFLLDLTFLVHRQLSHFEWLETTYQGVLSGFGQ